MNKLLGDVPTATAILDRFLHHAQTITFTGRSYRLRHSGEAPKPAKAPPGKRKHANPPKPAKAPPETAAEQEEGKPTKE